MDQTNHPKYFEEVLTVIPDNVAIDHLKEILSDGLAQCINEIKLDNTDTREGVLTNILSNWFVQDAVGNDKFSHIVSSGQWQQFNKDVIKMTEIKLKEI